jgi:hypothetical protein
MQNLKAPLVDNRLDACNIACFEHGSEVSCTAQVERTRSGVHVGKHVFLQAFVCSIDEEKVHCKISMRP